MFQHSLGFCVKKINQASNGAFKTISRFEHNAGQNTLASEHKSMN